MADPAAQSSLVSSSSSSTSLSSSSACSTRGLVGSSMSSSDPPNSSSSSSSSSSSQPVSLFAASPAAPGGRERGPPQSPPESPESPFEVVPDRAAFDREFGPALAQIPEGRECHFPPSPRGTGTGTGPGRAVLARPPPGSAAALEEVSRCVREMHSFTSELLSWDLVERRGDGGGDGTGDGSEGDGGGSGVNGGTGAGNGVASFGNGVTAVTAIGKGVTSVTSAGSGITGVTAIGNGVTAMGNGVTGVTGVTSAGSAITGVTAMGNGFTGVTGMGNGVAGVGGGLGGLGGLGAAVPAVPSPSSASAAPGSVPGVGSAVPAVPADADSSGDSDDTVIEEGPAETPPAGPKAVPAVPAVPKAVPAVPKAVPKAVPAVPKAVPAAVPAVPKAVPAAVPDVPKAVPAVPVPPGSPHWDQEHRTLRELGEPPPAGTLPRLAAIQELLLWRDPRRSAAAFGASLVLLLSLATLSAVSVLAHVALALLSVTVSLRVYRAVLQALHKSDQGHPFRAYLDLDVALSPEAFQAHAAAVAQHVNRALQLLLRLFLVEDLVDSLELALTMWLMTYVGAVFNGITLLILADILAFTLPPLYEKYEVQISHYMALVRHQTKELMAKLQAKLPGLAPKKPE